MIKDDGGRNGETGVTELGEGLQFLKSFIGYKDVFKFFKNVYGLFESKTWLFKDLKNNLIQGVNKK